MKSPTIICQGPLCRLLLWLLSLAFRRLLRVGKEAWGRILAEHARLDRGLNHAMTLPDPVKFDTLVGFAQEAAGVPHWLAKRIAQAAHLYARLLEERTDPIPF